MNEDATVRLTRRQVLAGASSAGLAGLAGCGLFGGTQSVDPPTLGDPDAGVTVQVFEDYACPHCARYSLRQFPRVVSEYVQPGQVRYEHYDFPIPVARPESWRAANAARAVYETVGTDAFWRYSHELFRNQAQLGPALYADIAGDVGAEPSAIRQAALDRAYQSTIEASRKYGRNLGVRGTPTIFVNGNELSGYGFQTISRAIESEL